MLKRAKAQAQSDAEAAGPAGKPGKDLSQAVLNSSHQIWLAGLGAFSRAQQEGTKVFENLVRQGQELETKTRRAAAETASAARDAAAEKAKEMQKMAGGTWDKLEQVFEDRVARALSKLGVYTQNDVKQLSERVDALSEAVNRLINTSSMMGGAKIPTKTAGASATSRGQAATRARKHSSSAVASSASGNAAKQAKPGPAPKRTRRGAATRS